MMALALPPILGVLEELKFVAKMNEESKSNTILHHSLDQRLEQ
jgi:hypothetical protein